MKEQIKILLELLYEKGNIDALTEYGRGMKDILDLIESEDGYGIDDIINELKKEIKNV